MTPAPVVPPSESNTDPPTGERPTGETRLANVVAPAFPGGSHVPPGIRAGMRVMIKDRDVGSVARVLSDSTAQCATHLVIRRGLFGLHRPIVPMDRVVATTLERIVVDLRPDELAALPEYRPDDQIALDVERAIGDDEIVRRLSAPHLTMAVHNGVVTVTGNIASSTHRQRVEDAVRRVRGVRGLQNVPIGDDELEVAVAQVLGQDPRTGRSIILVNATLGIVRLSGAVPAVALDLARAVPGVREVRTVEPLRPS
jgi:osmotically-inducible protein OsmY